MAVFLISLFIFYRFNVKLQQRDRNFDKESQNSIYWKCELHICRTILDKLVFSFSNTTRTSEFFEIHRQNSEGLEHLTIFRMMLCLTGNKLSFSLGRGGGGFEIPELKVICTWKSVKTMKRCMVSIIIIFVTSLSVTQLKPYYAWDTSH